MKLIHKSKSKSLMGAKLCGGNPENIRVANDFYATDPKALEKLLSVFELKKNGRCLEPCVGQGHLSDVIKCRLTRDVMCMDIIDRGYEDTITDNYLTHNFKGDKFDYIITNPPFSLAEEFIRKSMNLLKDKGYCVMFLKIQFLEGVKRKELFEEFPPKYIYVFRKRMATWNNGNRTDSQGKRWSTTFCHAWFVFQKDNTDEPIVRWID